VRSLVDARTIASKAGGASHAAIYRLVHHVLADRQRGGRLVDVGCGRGLLDEVLRGLFDRCVGLDILAFPGTPQGSSRVLADLERALPLADGIADVTTAVETIEHLENPRAFVRELVRITRPGGLVLVTTPNQLSALSLLALLCKKRFAAFQDVHYPAHRTALLEVDLLRIFAECGLVHPAVHFTHHSRLPLTALTYPRWLARRFPSLLSDNVLVVARKPALNAA
jgi:2-polyprenyl-3-methyl-5-hydroxy-6-metoxy-1,4-benzoquinol methylase